MGEFSFWHILMVFGIVLLFFGPSRLPGLGNSLGKAIRGFKKGLNETTEENPLQLKSEAQNTNKN